MPIDKTKQAVAVFNKNAQRYQDRFMDTSRYHETFDVFCTAIAANNAHVLELGCGPGNITQYLLQQRPDLQILATDLAPAMINIARVSNPQAEFQLLDCRDVLTLNRKFDAVMCGFCIPYLSKDEAIKLIADIAATLHAGGIIYLSCMEDEYNNSGLQTASSGDELFVYYHQSDYLLQAIESNLFKMIDVWQQGNGEGSAKDLIIVAQLIAH